MHLLEQFLNSAIPYIKQKPDHSNGQTGPSDRLLFVPLPRVFVSSHHASHRCVMLATDEVGCCGISAAHITMPKRLSSKQSHALQTVRIPERKTGGLSKVGDEVEAGQVRWNNHSQGTEGWPLRHRLILLRPEAFLPGIHRSPCLRSALDSYIRLPATLGIGL